MSRPVIIEDEARANIIKAAAWWAKHRDQGEAQRWYDGILIAIETLADNPPAAFSPVKIPSRTMSCASCISALARDQRTVLSL